MKPATEIANASDILALHDPKSLSTNTFYPTNETAEPNDVNVENASAIIFRSQYSNLIKEELFEKPDTETKDQIMHIDQDIIGARQQRNFHNIPFVRNLVSTSKNMDEKQYIPNRTELSSLSDLTDPLGLDVFAKQSLSDDKSSLLKPLR